MTLSLWSSNHLGQLQVLYLHDIRRDTSGGASNDSGIVDDANFSVFGGYCLETLDRISRDI